MPDSRPTECDVTTEPGPKGSTVESGQAGSVVPEGVVVDEPQVRAAEGAATGTPEAIARAASPHTAEKIKSTWVRAPKVEEALGHWSTLVENFHTSTQDFYTALQAALKRRRVPGINMGRVHFSGGGITDPERVYFRIKRGDLKIDVCAAPYGTGFFFSWWVAGRIPRWWIALLVAGLLLTVMTWAMADLGFGAKLMATLAIAFFVGIGSIFVQRLVKRITYYAVDTVLMFKAAVHAAMTETIDGLLTAKGLRALSDDQKKPIMREFLKG